MQCMEEADFIIGSSDGPVDAPPGCLAEVIREVRRRYGYEKPAWVVGSRVDGSPRPDSDIDVVVQTMCSTMKSDGCGVRLGLRCGITLDITEDEDGPIWRGEDSMVRIQ